jgi:peptide/nickel transport system ATP-binding protein
MERGMSGTDDILRIEGLQVVYQGRSGEHRVVDGLDLTVRRGEFLGIAGESGSGKTTLVTAVLRLIRPPGFIRGGHAWFRPEPGGAPVDLLALDEPALRRLRWAKLSYVPQGSMNVLNPVVSIGRQMADTLLVHGLSQGEAKARIAEAVIIVNLPPDVVDRYPHELSGGMRQRVAIASAITMRPPLILADEPTTALDVNVQRQILLSLARIRQELGITTVLVSHDMAALAQVAERLAIMYAGQVVEAGDIYRVFASPLHPYSQRLISSVPTLGGERRRIEGIPGLAPSPRNWPLGCRFHPRCPAALPICREQPPAVTLHEGMHRVACHLYPRPMTGDRPAVIQEQVVAGGDA